MEGSIKEFEKFVSEYSVSFVSFRFTDTRGKLLQIDFDVETIDANLINEGVSFDGSSVEGWEEVHSSDMLLRPDLSSCFIDPFPAQTTAVILCDVIDPKTGSNYNKDPRSIAKAAERYLHETGLGELSYFGPEVEFFVFDDVRYQVSAHEMSYNFDAKEGPHNSIKNFTSGNNAFRPKTKAAYAESSPKDNLADFRAELMQLLKAMNIRTTLHHHEVAPSQCELGIKYSTLTSSADNVVKYKYGVRNAACNHGKTATFMPKPVLDDNGNGMHVHQSIFSGGQNLFYHENGYDYLSNMAIYYIGGILKHARAINAFSNPTTNSYKRLVPGYEAPVVRAYSAKNRSVAIRIPYDTAKSAKRIEIRFPDPTANPYLTFSAMLMAGIDGINNKIHPGEAVDENVFKYGEDELRKLPHLASDLGQAVKALENDYEFLLKGGVFSREQLQHYIELRKYENNLLKRTPHPIEYELYYND
jgi:glutamine synthetase